MKRVDIRPEAVDEDYVWGLFERFVAADTSARIGENRIEPHDPRLARFAADFARPALEELGASVTIDELNNVVATFGPATGRELMFVAYPALHHGNEMEAPLDARRSVLDSGSEAWVGLGASQSKAGLAAIAGAVRLLQAQGVDPAGSVVIAVSSEGCSSHASAEVLYRGFERLPIGAVLVIGTENRISLGNRGRVDVVVEIAGRATHSSAPELGLNPIPIVGTVQERLAAMPLSAAPHADLGARALEPYKLTCGPIAPHTIPESCVLVLDRRLLPGDEPAVVVQEIADALAGLPVRVSQGATMLPALVDRDAAVVLTLQRGANVALDAPLQTMYPPYTFDAGYGCKIGVPTVMCGPSSGDISGAGVLAEDFVEAARVRDAAAVFAAAVAANADLV